MSQVMWLWLLSFSMSRISHQEHCSQGTQCRLIRSYSVGWQYPSFLRGILALLLPCWHCHTIIYFTTGPGNSHRVRLPLEPYSKASSIENRAGSLVDRLPGESLIWRSSIWWGFQMRSEGEQVVLHHRACNLRNELMYLKWSSHANQLIALLFEVTECSQ